MIFLYLVPPFRETCIHSSVSSDQGEEYNIAVKQKRIEQIDTAMSKLSFMYIRIQTLKFEYATCRFEFGC